MRRSSTAQAAKCVGHSVIFPRIIAMGWEDLGRSQFTREINERLMTSGLILHGRRYDWHTKLCRTHQEIH